MWQTRITEMFGIKYPIIQGAFGTFGTADFAVPVSEAGGLGMITAAGFGTPENFREELRKAKSMTDKPLAVNLTIMGCPEIEAMRDVIMEEGGIVAVETAPMRADFLGKSLEGASEQEVAAEVLRSVPGSLAVGAIDSIPTIKELMQNLISEAEVIRRRWSIS